MKRPGFSLIEMMIAVLIIGLGLVSLLSVTGSALQVIRTADEINTATQLLDRLAMEAPIQLEDLEEDEEEGDFEGEAFKGYSWTRVIEIYGVEEDELFKVTETVKWESRGETGEQKVEYLIHKPTAKFEGFVDEDATGWDE